MIDIDATLIQRIREGGRGGAASRGGFGFDPLPGYLDESREALAGVLRPGIVRHERPHPRAQTTTSWESRT